MTQPPGLCVAVKGQLLGIGHLSPPGSTWETKLGCQAWRQVPIPAQSGQGLSGPEKGNLYYTMRGIENYYSYHGNGMEVPPSKTPNQEPQTNQPTRIPENETAAASQAFHFVEAKASTFEEENSEHESQLNHQSSN